MKLVFFSGGSARANRALASEFQGLLRAPSPKIAFIPAHGEDWEDDYEAFKAEFFAYGYRRFECFVIDGEKLKPQAKKRLLQCDAIYLGGGNTFYFLKNLRTQGLLRPLKQYVQTGGLLLGQSAGSILMTPNIRTASVPSLDEDENDVGLKDLRSLGLVRFEFSPHYRSHRRADQELKEYSKKLPYPVYACADGNGIVVEGKKISFVGKVNAFVRGEKIILQ